MDRRRLGAFGLGLFVFVAACKRDAPSEAPSATAEAPATDPSGFDLPEGTGPVATVNGVDIPREALNSQLVQNLERYRRAKHDIKPALRERLVDNIVQRLVDQELIRQNAEKLGVKLDPEVLKAKWEEHKKRYGSKEAFQAFLERAGTTAEDTRARFDENHLREAVFKRVGEAVTVSGEEIREFFESNRQRYDEPEMVRARHILIRVPTDASDQVVAEKKALAQKVRAQAAKKGADFAALAKQYGEDPTKDRGGDLGFFPEGRMVKPFQEAVWPLKKGAVSPVVRTQFGFHIIEKTDHKKPSKRSLADVSDQIERALLARKRNQAIRDAMETWKKEADLEIFVKADPDVLNAGYDEHRHGSTGIPGTEVAPVDPKKPGDPHAMPGHDAEKE